MDWFLNDNGLRVERVKVVYWAKDKINIKSYKQKVIIVSLYSWVNIGVRYHIETSPLICI